MQTDPHTNEIIIGNALLIGFSSDFHRISIGILSENLKKWKPNKAIKAGGNPSPGIHKF